MKAKPEVGHAIGFTSWCEFCYQDFPTSQLWEVPNNEGSDYIVIMCDGCHDILFPVEEVSA